jgi:hypothetical protein
MADDPKRAARISKLARGVEKAFGDNFFGYLAYAVDTHQDYCRCNRTLAPVSTLQRLALERDSCIRTAFAQAAPR